MTGSIYVAGSLNNTTRIQEIQNKFRSVGIEITYDWTIHGFVDNDELLPEIGKKERDGVLTCDVFFLVQPGRHGSHTELGIALAMNELGAPTPIVIFQEAGTKMEKKPFYYLDCVHRFQDEQLAFEFALDQIGKKHECTEKT